MTTFEDLYKRLLKNAVNSEKTSISGADEGHLDCLFHPEKHAPVWQIKKCECEGNGKCTASCLFDAISRDESGKITIDAARCSGCSACIEACNNGTLVQSRDVLPALYAVKEASGPVYALIAPAFLGQFSDGVTPGKLRTAFRDLGFDGMIEVALFADVLTLKEALEFDRNVKTITDFQLASCCCPIWIGMIRKMYSELIPHVPGAVSPMIAAGRAVKKMHPDAVTVFIGPCVAKKAEAREPDISGAVDFVLTFREMQDIFDAAGINPSEMKETERDHSSRAGRLYAKSGGVSEAVRETVKAMSPERNIAIKTKMAEGVPSCRAMIESLKNGSADANFFEGMGCIGGCVGGPKAVLDRQTGRVNVERYGDEAEYKTPLNNPYVLKMLNELGFETVEEFLENSDIFIRKFD
ncbi:MAG: iron hydrogenase [Clostridiales bacterium]|nr:MAG: iron hydrogenase [Clostridiales bacterium]